MQDAAYTKIQVGGPKAKKRGVALVDDADEEAVAAHPWSMSNGYAVRNAQVGGKWRIILMHRFLLGLTHDDGVHVDHINGNMLDNRRENLRTCTRSQNMQNRHHCGSCRGAYWVARRYAAGLQDCWLAQAQLAGKTRYLGYYATQEEAAEASAAFRRANMPYSRDARDAAA